ncbi:TPA: glycosyltransferase family A protein [Photobacterium damselae]
MYLKKFFIKVKEWFFLPSKINNLENNIKEEMIKNRLQAINLEQLSPQIATGTIVTLTTYGNHIHDIHYVIRSILKQTVRPEFIVLWLDEIEFNDDDIPISLSELKKYGLLIKYCNDIKSYKKIIPSINKYKNYNLITIDDDYLYPDDMIETLIKESIKYPNVIITHRAHYIKFKGGDVDKYNNWEYETKINKPSHYIFPTTGGGVFFPAKIFTNEVTNQDIFMSLCPSADDVWLKIMALISNVKCKKVDDDRNWDSRFVELNVSQTNALSLINVGNSHNDKQLEMVMKYYGLSRKDFEIDK